MEVYRRSSGLLLLLGFALLATTLQGVQGEVESEGPSESECRPYIEKALKELEAGEVATGSSEAEGDSKEDIPTVEITDDSGHQEGDGDDNDRNEGKKSSEIVEETVTETKPEPEVRQTMFQKITKRISQFFQKSPKSEIKEAAIEDKKLEDKELDANQETDQTTDAENEETEDGQQSTEQDDKSKENDAEIPPPVTDSKEESNEDEEKKDDDVTTEQDDKTGDEDDNDDQQPRESVETTESQEETAQEPAESEEEERPLADDASKEKEDEDHEETDEQQGEAAEEEVIEIPGELGESVEDQAASHEEQVEASKEEQVVSQEEQEGEAVNEEQQAENAEQQVESVEDAKDDLQAESKEEQIESKEDELTESKEDEPVESKEEGPADSKEEPAVETSKEESPEDEKQSESLDGPDSKEDELRSVENDESKENVVHEDEGIQTPVDDEDKSAETDQKESIEDKDESEKPGDSDEKSEEPNQQAEESESEEVRTKREITDESADEQVDDTESSEDKQGDSGSVEEGDVLPVEELSLDVELPTDLRSRDYVERLLKLDEESSETEKIINQVNEITLKALKKLYENAIKPLEVLYKYRDLSNRHFGDAEIFSKPLILFMGPWSGGKSTIINYLLNIEYNETALRTGAEPSPAYFNILMYGEEPEIVDGTELAADFTFSGLQKFGQGLEERLRGVKIPTKLTEKVNIVEIPGILEVRKQVSRVFPFNDACQWFIDRADIIFLVYDPSKLDVGPETEAILDQLKGREHQTRIILNKADQVKPEELMRVQGALIWNISPLMSSPQPPIMYTTSLWSRPYESWAPARLLQAQERAFLRDLRSAIDKRIENKIASARRFAVRVRNHAKMVDCYLTTYYNHKSVFGNRKQVADTIIEHPQDYHIYEGLSTLTNISRYDLPDPDVYKDFFKLNPLYEFQQLSATCTYFRGCPINRLDIAIAYDLPELIGTHKKLVENALAAKANQSTSVPGS